MNHRGSLDFDVTADAGQLVAAGTVAAIGLFILPHRRSRAKRELAEKIGIVEQNVSLLKSGKVKGVHFETLERIYRVLDCQPGDILEFRETGD